LRMNMMISYQELVRTFPNFCPRSTKMLRYSRMLGLAEKHCTLLASIPTIVHSAKKVCFNSSGMYTAIEKYWD
ncbi:hypothetical protein, partial [Enterobacter sp. SECR19-1250]